MYGEPRPETTASITARLEAYASQPFPPTSEDGNVVTTPGLYGQKLAALLRAEYPPTPQSQHDDVRALMPELIDLGEKWVTAEDTFTVFHGYSVLLRCCGLGLGLRRVPYSIIEQMAAYSMPGDGIDQIRSLGTTLAGLLRKVYPPISAEEFRHVETWLPSLIDHAEKMSQHAAPEISLLGNIFLEMALGIKVGLFKAPISITLEFMPKQ